MKKLSRYTKKLVTVKNELKGKVTINDKELVEGEDFIVNNEGICLSKERQQELDSKNTKSYSFYFSREIVKKLK